MTSPSADALFADHYRAVRGRLGMRASAPLVHIVRPPPPAQRGPSKAERGAERARREAEVIALRIQRREAMHRRDAEIVALYRQSPVLRYVAAAFSMSHEGVRKVLQRHQAPVRLCGSPLLPLPEGLGE